MKNWQRIEQAAGIGFVALVVVGCAVVLRPFVTAILWAAIVCYATWPLYRRLERSCGRRKSLAAALMTVLITVVMVLPFAVVGLTFADNLTRLAQRLNEYRTGGLPEPPDWVRRLPVVGQWLQGYWAGLAANADRAAEVLGGWFDRSRGWMLARSLALGRGIFELTISVVISFFFYRDGPAVVARVSEGVRRITGDFSQHLVEVVGNTTKSVVYGLLGTAVAQGTMAGIGFRIAGIPGAFLWGLLTFFLSLFPAGPPLVWVPATLWLLFRDEVGWAVFMGLWGFFAISGIDNIVRPMLISRGTTLPFALTLLGVMGGVFAFGFIGVFLGPTVLAAGYSLLQEFLRQKRGGATEPADLATGAPPAPGAAGAPPP